MFFFFLMVSVLINRKIKTSLELEATSSLQRILFLRLPALEILCLEWQREWRCLHLKTTSTVTEKTCKVLSFPTCRVRIKCSFRTPSNFWHQTAVQLIHTSHFYYLCGLFKTVWDQSFYKTKEISFFGKDETFVTLFYSLQTASVVFFTPSFF